MQYLPIGIDLKNKLCLVVGGGKVAARKIQRLLDAGAAVSVVAIEICDDIADLSDHDKLSLKQATYSASDLQGVYLVVAATSDSSVNKEIAVAAEKNKILCNAAESAEAGSVIFPSLIHRKPVVISVSSDGASPVLASVLSAQIEAFIPQYISRLAQISARYRAVVKERFDTIAQRRRFWSSVMTGRVMQLLRANKEDDAEAEIAKLLNEDRRAGSADGEVYLVGAGPGDPELLTLGALRLMQRAEVILHDRLVSDEVLALCPTDAEYVYVGKERSSHAMRQQRINQSLVDYAKQGKRVLRLKGGDPFIFGRGGEEIETLADQGVKFQVVPGITAASGCASYAGIPLTHRDYAQSCVFVAGQLKDGTINLPWKSLAIPRQTIVCYMGLVGLAHICASLIEAGLDKEMPAALVEQGTTPQQRVIVGNLSTLPTIVAQHSVKAPTLIIIGEVVTLHDRLAWLD